MNLKLFFVFFVPVVVGELETLFSWKVLEFDTPPGYPVNPNYQKNSTFITGIEFLEDKVIIATPRFFPGAPASLSWIPLDGGESPKLKAYPDWSWHEKSVTGKKNCDGIISPFRMNVDYCGQLWVIDAGKEVNEPKGVCPPSILIFRPNTNFFQRIVLPDHVVLNNTLVINIALWSSPDCSITRAYIADVQRPALIVYDGGKFIRYTHSSMYSNPKYQNYPYFGHNFYSDDGIFGLAVDKYNGLLYYKVFAGTAISMVDLQNLHNAAKGGFPVMLLRNSSSQGGGMAFGLRRRALVYSNVEFTNIVAYTKSGESVLEYAPNILRYVTDMKPYGRDRLVMVSANLQNYFTGSVDTSKINNRILLFEE